MYVHVELARLLSGIGNNGLRYFYLEIERLLVEINMYKTLESRHKITGKSYRLRYVLKRKKKTMRVTECNVIEHVNVIRRYTNM